MNPSGVKKEGSKSQHFVEGSYQNVLMCMDFGNPWIANGNNV